MVCTLLSSRELLPHGSCYQWKPVLLWLHAASDTLIAAAYFLIPLALLYFVRKRRDLPFSWMFVCFSVFIAACGATHVMDVWTLWVPSYWLSGGVKVITAIASVPTALFLVQVMPKVLSLPRPEELRAANAESGATRLQRYSAETIDIGGKQCSLTIGHDITVQKQVAEALRLSEEKFSKAFRNCPTMISISTLHEGVFLEINESFEKHTGYTRSEVLGRTASDIGLWVDRKESQALLAALEKHGCARDLGIHLRAKSGQIVVAQISVELIEIRGEQCQLIVAQNITDRKRSEVLLRQLSAQLLRSQDEERRKIAQELHDSTGQDLVALATMIGQLRVAIPAAEHKPRRLVSECAALADRCVRQVRTLSYVLHPPILDEAGLEQAIRDYVKGFTKRSGIAVSLELSALLGRMPQDVELGLFRVVQESLANIHRHSGSAEARIRIDRGAQFTLQISDLGKRASASAHRGGTSSPLEFGVGIPAMEERVKLIGGRLDVDVNDNGTTVRVTLPLNGERYEKIADPGR
jgi:PAS domain S-box-containing protein